MLAGQCKSSCAVIRKLAVGPQRKIAVAGLTLRHWHIGRRMRPGVVAVIVRAIAGVNTLMACGAGGCQGVAAERNPCEANGNWRRPCYALPSAGNPIAV